MKIPTYVEALSESISKFNAVVAAGTCNPAVIDDIVDWVTKRDPEASRLFGQAVQGGTGAYQALQDRLGHDQNALNLVKSCSIEARQSLATRGYIG